MANGTIAFDTLQTSGQITGTAKSLDTDFVVSGSAKAWLNQDSGTSIRDSFNIASITDTSTGQHTKTMTNAMDSINYSGGGSAASSINSASSGNRMMSANPSTTTVVFIVCFDTSGNKSDLGYIGSNIFGDLA
tara:strand:- start:62 stop:460 length:399 start_codon:yes stop_codon:yes gene_type:complete